MSETDRKPNRLIREKSPYLLQHAYNPVDWHAWGNDVFEKASLENKPVFLSIGYSTCHWCHVMEEESFENERIAAILNRHFISIKVDREERPDIDQVYMDAVMAMTGAGGWPLNLFLTSEKKAFFGGTYFPPDDCYGRPGFETVLLHLAGQWESERERVAHAGESIAKALGNFASERGKEKKQLTESTLDKAYDQYEKIFDSVHGGFAKAPKFPTPHLLSFLLQYYHRSKKPEALGMVRRTLEAMRRGGIYDHLGGGFHRYSTDERWHVPHFEKMLYDQALLAKAYIEAFQITGALEYAQTAKAVFDYVCRDLRGNHGAFLSAEDADSAPEAATPKLKKEGAYYVWKHDELIRTLDQREIPVFTAFFGVVENGNVEQDPFGEFSGANILHAAEPLESISRRMQMPAAEVTALLESAKQRLLKARDQRLRPHLDDKVLADWNGLMIAAMASGGRVLGLPELTLAAEKAASFILSEMIREGRLYHRWRDGEAAINGFLDDYAFFIYALIELYESTFNPVYLKHARDLALQMIELFEDTEKGGFFFSERVSRELPANPKPLYDGAVPSGNSVAIHSLARLGRLLRDQALESAALRALDSFSGEISDKPSLYPFTLMALDFLIGPTREVVVAATKDKKATEALLGRIRKGFAPSQVVLLCPDERSQALLLQDLVPFAVKYLPVDGLPAAYICQGKACKAPVTLPAELERMLDVPSGEFS